MQFFFDLPNISKTDIPQKRIIKYRDVKTLDIPGLASSLSTSLQSAFCDKVDTSNFSELLNIYNETVSTEFNNHAPLKTKTLTTSAESPPWLDSEYKSNRAVRRRLEQKFVMGHLRYNIQVLGVKTYENTSAKLYIRCYSNL